MKFKKAMLVTFVLLAILTIGAVSASDDADDLAVVEMGGNDLDIVETPIDDVQSNDLLADDDVSMGGDKLNASYEIDSYVSVDSLDNNWNDVVKYQFYDEDATGTFAIFLNGTEIYNDTVVTYGEVSLSSNDLGLYDFDYGTYNIDFVYSGDEKFNGFNETRTIELTYSFEIYSYVSVDSLDRDWNHVVEYYFEVKDAGGTFAIFLNGTEVYNDTVVTDEWVSLSSNDLGLYDFDYGTYNIDFVYSGDEKFKGFNETRTIELTYRFNAYRDDDGSEGYIGAVYGYSYSYAVSVPEFRGKLVYTINGNEHEVDIEDYDDYELYVTIAPEDMIYGENNVTFKYVNDGYPVRTIEKSFDCKAVMRSQSAYFDEPICVTLEFPKNATGTLKVYEIVGQNGYWDGEEYQTVRNLTLLAEGEVVNGIVNVSIHNLTVGTHRIWANFTGEYDIVLDLDYYYDNLEFRVYPRIIVPKNVYKYGTYTAEVLFPKYCNGELLVELGNETRTFNLTEGRATFELFNLDYVDEDDEWMWEGDYVGRSLRCTFEGNSYSSDQFYVYSVSPNFEIKFSDKYANQTIIRNSGFYRNYFRIPGGNVTIYLDDVYYGMAEIEYEMEYMEVYVSVSADNLTLGNHEVRFEYSGYGYYLPATSYDYFNVAYSDIYIPKEALIGEYYGDYESDYAYVELPDDATGEITLVVDGVNVKTVQVDYGYAKFELSDLAYGNHTVALIYQNGNYPSVNKSGNVEAKYKYFLKSDYMIYGEENEIRLPIGATGEVIINIAGKQFNVPINENGSAVFNLMGVGAGEYEMNVTYAGDGKYPAGVEKFNVTIEYTINSNLGYGGVIRENELENYTIELTLPENATGKLVISYYDDPDVEIAVFNLTKGSVNVTLNDVLNGIPNKSGYWDIWLMYVGDDYDVRSDNVGFDIVAYQLTKEFNEDYVTLGETVKYTLESSKNLTGYLQVLTGSRYKTVFYNNISIENGVAIISFNASTLGSNSFKLVYVGEDYDIEEYMSFYVWPENTTLVEKASGDETLFTVKMPSDAAGNLTVFLSSYDDDQLTVKSTYKGSVAFINASEIHKGFWNLISFKIDDEKYGSFNSRSITLYYGEFEIEDVPVGADSNLTASSENINVGETAVIYISIDKNATGKVTVDDNEVNIINGSGKYEISGLKEGAYTYIVKFAGDGCFRSGEKTVTIVASKLPGPALTVTVDDIDYGKDALILISTDETFSGEVSVRIGDKKYPVNVTKGKGNTTVPALNANDEYTAIAIFEGTDFLKESRSNDTFKVSKVDAPLVVSPLDVLDYGSSVNVTFEAEGEVTATIDGETVPVIGNVISIPVLSADVHKLSVTALADANHNEVTVNITFTVRPAKSVVSLGENLIFDYGLSGSISMLLINASSVKAEVIDHPEAIIDYNYIDGQIVVSNLSVGSYRMLVTTDVDGNYDEASDIVNVTVNRLVSHVSLGSDVVFDYGLSSSTQLVADCNVTAKVVDHPEAIVSVGDGVIVVSNLSAGNYVLLVSANVDAANYVVATDSVNVTVNRLVPHVSLGSDVVFDYGLSSSTQLVADCNVTAKVVGHPEAIVTVGNGEIVVSNLSVGNYVLLVSADVDAANYVVATASVNVTVNKLSSGLSLSNNIVFDYNSFNSTGFTSNVDVVAEVVGHPEAIVTVGDGKIVVSGLNAGKYTLIVKIVADASNYDVSTASVSITVNKLPSVLTATPVETTYGTSKWMYVKLTSNGARLSNKTVTFVINKVPYTATTNNKGIAKIATPKKLAASTKPYSVSISFSDANYAKSSVKNTLLVNKATPKLTAAGKTFKVSDSIKKYYVVVKTDKGVLYNGKVTIKVGSNKYVVKKMKKGVATFSFNKLVKKGRYNAIVKFAGDSKYKAVSKKVKIIVK